MKRAHSELQVLCGALPSALWSPAQRTHARSQRTGRATTKQRSRHRLHSQWRRVFKLSLKHHILRTSWSHPSADIVLLLRFYMVISRMKYPINMLPSYLNIWHTYCLITMNIHFHAFYQKNKTKNKTKKNIENIVFFTVWYGDFQLAFTVYIFFFLKPFLLKSITI